MLTSLARYAGHVAGAFLDTAFGAPEPLAGVDTYPAGPPPGVARVVLTTGATVLLMDGETLDLSQDLVDLEENSCHACPDVGACLRRGACRSA